MIDILPSPPQLPSASSSISSVTHTNNDGLRQLTLLNHESHINRNPVALYSRNCITSTQIQEVEAEEREEGDQFSVLAVLLTIFRKSVVGCGNISGVEEQQLMEIGRPTNVRHVAHVTFDRFNGFLGLPVEFEPEVPKRPPSASTRVFGVSTYSMQLSFDSIGNCVPTILLMMQRRLYSQGGLQFEGIFRINPENGQEEYVREQLNNGVIPDNIDVHCLAGLIKAWFRELPNGVLDSLQPEQVIQAQSEEACTRLARLLPPTEASLLDWVINLMADVAQLEHLNKMNARNIAMVFAPNMTQMSDPLTALMYAVQVMNFLKTLILKTLRERKESLLETSPMLQFEPLDEDDDHSIPKAVNLEEANEASEEEDVVEAKEPLPDHTSSSGSQAESRIGNENNGFLSSIENILPEGKADAADISRNDTPNAVIRSGRTRTHPRIQKRKTVQLSNSNNGSRKHAHKPVVHVSGTAEKRKELNIVSRLNSHEERIEAWR